MTKNILLIGGAGFIGSNLVKKFISNPSYNLFILEPESADLKRLKKFRRIVLIHGDLKDLVFVNKILEQNEIHLIFHLVSTLIPSSTLEDYQNEMNNLMLPSMNIMKLCSERGIQFVYFSSGGTIYGNSNQCSRKETDELAPISYYGLSKHIMEEAVRFESRKSGMKYLIIRPSNPYGYGQNLFGKQGIIAVALGKYLEKQKMTIWGDGETIRDYIYIEDLAEYLYQIIEKNIENEIFNIGSGEGYSINDILQTLNDVLPSTIQTEYKEQRSIDVKSIILDTGKLRSIVNIEPTGIRQGIQAFIRELKSNQQNLINL